VVDGVGDFVLGFFVMGVVEGRVRFAAIVTELYCAPKEIYSESRQSVTLGPVPLEDGDLSKAHHLKARIELVGEADDIKTLSDLLKISSRSLRKSNRFAPLFFSQLAIRHLSQLVTVIVIHRSLPNELFARSVLEVQLIIHY
jgi:hypothetical protein